MLFLGRRLNFTVDRHRRIDGIEILDDLLCLDFTGAGLPKNRRLAGQSSNGKRKPSGTRR
jgi:hypothetical protein